MIQRLGWFFEEFAGLWGYGITGLWVHELTGLRVQGFMGLRVVDLSSSGRQAGLPLFSRQAGLFIYVIL
jgi:hypothetical protein